MPRFSRWLWGVACPNCRSPIEKLAERFAEANRNDVHTDNPQTFEGRDILPELPQGPRSIPSRRRSYLSCRTTRVTDYRSPSPRLSGLATHGRCNRGIDSSRLSRLA